MKNPTSEPTSRRTSAADATQRGHRCPSSQRTAGASPMAMMIATRTSVKICQSLNQRNQRKKAARTLKIVAHGTRISVRSISAIVAGRDVQDAFRSGRLADLVLPFEHRLFAQRFARRPVRLAQHLDQGEG